jgi:hypothetical protein
MATFGDRLMALFGAPTAHEDDTERAVQAALEIRATLSDTNREIVRLLQDWTAAHPDQRSLLRVANVALHQRIGIASGTVFAAVVGARRRHEYMVIGETVHVAARTLAAAVDGEILLTSMTYRAVRDRVEVEPLAPLPLTHAAKPVPAFRLLGWRERAGPAADTLPQAAPMIGRRAELARALDLARVALTSGPDAGQVLALAGEPGVGKSRLAAEVIRALQAIAPAVTFARDACHSYEQTIPYAAIVRLLRQALDLPIGARPAQTGALLRRIEELIPAWSRFAPLLGPLLNLPIPETPLTRALTPQSQRERLHDLIVVLCLAITSQRPLVLTIDDLQWADASSQALIQRLATELAGHRLLLLLVYRPTRELAEPWRELPHATTIALPWRAGARRQRGAAGGAAGRPPAGSTAAAARTNAWYAALPGGNRALCRRVGRAAPRQRRRLAAGPIAR